MVRQKPVLPAGHGELLEQPPFGDWARLVEANRAAVQRWDFEIGSGPAAVSGTELRALARREALNAAAGFSARLGVDVSQPGDPDGAIVLTGHQPELYHTGVWAKDFLLDRMARECGATALDLVVDSDGFENVGITTPCFRPEVSRCHAYLALGVADGYFAGTSVPDGSDLDDFCTSVDEQLSTLPAPSLSTHFERFCEALRSAASDARNLAELVTFARRRYEASAGTDYLELPITLLAQTEAYLLFFAHVALDATSFADAYNSELADYRALNSVRNALQPVPDLSRSESGAVELPFWLLRAGVRETAFVRLVSPDGVSVENGAGERFALIPTSGGLLTADSVRALGASGITVAPKALALTLFTRMFVCDFMIHGVGGGRYDQVTDGIIRRYFGVEPPAFAVASLTMYLPLGAHVVTDAEVADAKDRLNRLEHNPDTLLDEVDFDSAAERSQATRLSVEKRDLVAAIAAPGADKKALGMRIREVNAELSALLAPLRLEFTLALESLESQRAASEILTDRGYPFCFWSPEEVADKIR